MESLRGNWTFLHNVGLQEYLKPANIEVKERHITIHVPNFGLYGAELIIELDPVDGSLLKGTYRQATELEGQEITVKILNPNGLLGYPSGYVARKEWRLMRG